MQPVSDIQRNILLTIDEQKNNNRGHFMEQVVFRVKWKERRKASDSPKLSCVFILIVTFSHPVTTCREDVEFETVKEWCCDNGSSAPAVS